LARKKLQNRAHNCVLGPITTQGSMKDFIRGVGGGSKVNCKINKKNCSRRIFQILQHHFYLIEFVQEKYTSMFQCYSWQFMRNIENYLPHSYNKKRFLSTIVSNETS
jgi:hypothetical protein